MADSPRKRSVQLYHYYNVMLHVYNGLFSSHGSHEHGIAVSGFIDKQFWSVHFYSNTSSTAVRDINREHTRTYTHTHIENKRRIEVVERKITGGKYRSGESE